MVIFHSYVNVYQRVYPMTGNTMINPHQTKKRRSHWSSLGFPSGHPVRVPSCARTVRFILVVAQHRRGPEKHGAKGLSSRRERKTHGEFTWWFKRTNNVVRKNRSINSIELELEWIRYLNQFVSPWKLYGFLVKSWVHHRVERQNLWFNCQTYSTKSQKVMRILSIWTC